MNKFFKGKRAQLTTAGLLGLAAVTSASAAVDTTAIVAVITDAATAAAAIGVAVLSMHYGIKLYKWIKGAG
ncbi:MULTISPECIES: major capsid protein [Rhodanobacter]|uniref:major capsid protein n=1 Tax=Rhodanobacter TaxID=75309 RepID=UPI00041F77CF|nr:MULTISPECIES: major capsid protein [Rhodanobacter]TAN15918.1 MAG: hypothetical protein EPN35_11905 [Rhodanobacter sp.]UJJ53520.1 major capsid protein [Rhodanobacter thiooxydans]